LGLDFQAALCFSFQSDGFIDLLAGLAELLAYGSLQIQLTLHFIRVKPVFQAA
jgi:hypothetical protein